MGGIRSGPKQSRVESQFRVDVNVFVREQALIPGKSKSVTITRKNGHFDTVLVTAAENSVCLAFSVEGKRQELTLNLKWTANNYGGQRPWLVCPECGQKFVHIYVHDGACRECCKFVYQSQNEGWIKRSKRIRAEIEERLGWIHNEKMQAKPFGMSKREYEYWKREYSNHAKCLLAADMGKHCYNTWQGGPPTSRKWKNPNLARKPKVGNVKRVQNPNMRETPEQANRRVYAEHGAQVGDELLRKPMGSGRDNGDFRYTEDREPERVHNVLGF